MDSILPFIGRVCLKVLAWSIAHPVARVIVGLTTLLVSHWLRPTAPRVADVLAGVGATAVVTGMVEYWFAPQSDTPWWYWVLVSSAFAWL